MVPRPPEIENLQRCVERVLQLNPSSIGVNYNTIAKQNKRKE